MQPLTLYLLQVTTTAKDNPVSPKTGVIPPTKVLRKNKYRLFGISFLVCCPLASGPLLMRRGGVPSPLRPSPTASGLA